MSDESMHHPSIHWEWPIGVMCRIETHSLTIEAYNEAQQLLLSRFRRNDMNPDIIEATGSVNPFKVRADNTWHMPRIMSIYVYHMDDVLRNTVFFNSK